MPTAEHNVTNRDIQDRVLTLENKVQTIGEDLQDVRRDIHAGFARLETTGSLQKDKENDNRKFIIQVAVGLLATMFSSTFCVVLPGVLAISSLVYFVIDSRTSTAISPVREQSARNEESVRLLQQSYATEILDLKEKTSKSQEADANSRTDRANISEILRGLEKDVADAKRDIASSRAERLAKEVEIETQFNADGQLRNIQFSEQQRLNSDFQNALNGLGAKIPEYPKGPFYQPNISQEAKPIQ